MVKRESDIVIPLLFYRFAHYCNLLLADFQSFYWNIKSVLRNVKVIISQPNFVKTLFCREAIYALLAYFLQAYKCDGVQKMTNMRYPGVFLPVQSMLTKEPALWAE